MLVKKDFQSLKALTLKIELEHKDGEVERPLEVTVYPPAELVDGCESSIRVQADARQASFLRGFIAEVLPDVLTTLDVMAEQNGDGACDCENCKARRERVDKKPRLLN